MTMGLRDRFWISFTDIVIYIAPYLTTILPEPDPDDNKLTRRPTQQDLGLPLWRQYPQ